MTRVPRQTRFMNKQPRTIKLYEEEIKMLESLIQAEIKELERHQDKVAIEIKPYSQIKIIAAYSEMIEDFKELASTLRAET